MKRVLIRPIITEKTIADADERNQYTFLVAKAANKLEIAKAIADKFEVTVENVKTLNILGKHVSFGKKRIPGIRSTFKKAIVRLKSGDSIDIFNIS